MKRTQLVLPGCSEDIFFNNIVCHRLQIQKEPFALIYHSVDKSQPYWIFCGIYLPDLFKLYVELHNRFNGSILSWIVALIATLKDEDLENLTRLATFYQWMYFVMNGTEKDELTEQQLVHSVKQCLGYSIQSLTRIIRKSASNLDDFYSYVQHRLENSILLPEDKRDTDENNDTFDLRSNVKAFNDIQYSLFSVPEFQEFLLDDALLSKLKVLSGKSVSEAIELLKQDNNLLTVYKTVIDVLKNGVL
jgi:hypothetical protein